MFYCPLTCAFQQEQTFCNFNLSTSIFHNLTKYELTGHIQSKSGKLHILYILVFILNFAAYYELPTLNILKLTGLVKILKEDQVDLTQSSGGEASPEVIVIEDDSPENITPKRAIHPPELTKKLPKRKYGFRFHLPTFSDNEDTDSEPGMYQKI